MYINPSEYGTRNLQILGFPKTYLKIFYINTHPIQTNCKGKAHGSKNQNNAGTNMQGLLKTLVQACFCSKIQEINPCTPSLAIPSLEYLVLSSYTRTSPLFTLFRLLLKIICCLLLHTELGDKSHLLSV